MGRFVRSSSIATASRVVSSADYPVSAATRKRVLDAARTLDYVPNALARGLLRGLGYEGKVKSPTYTLVEFYKLSRLDLYHFDFYRFSDPREWDESGFREYFNSGSVCLVEWPERAAVGKTVVSSSMIDRVAANLKRDLREPLVYASILALLFLGRIPVVLARRRRQRSRPGGAAAKARPSVMPST